MRKMVEKRPADWETMYAALIAYPNDIEASEFLATQNMDCHSGKVAVYRRRCENPASPHFQPYMERRERLAPKLEARLAEDMLTNAQKVTETESFCLDQISVQIREGHIPADQLAKITRELSQARTQAIDKRLALQGRPTAIHENRNVDDIIKALASLGVVETPAIEATSEDA